MAFDISVFAVDETEMCLEYAGLKFLYLWESTSYRHIPCASLGASGRHGFFDVCSTAAPKDSVISFGDFVELFNFSACSLMFNQQPGLLETLKLI